MSRLHRRLRGGGDVPLEWWLLTVWVLIGLAVLDVAAVGRRVLLRRRARHWPSVEALLTETPSRDGSPLLRYRTPDGVLRSAPAVEGRRGIDDLRSGATVLVHIDPRDPQRVVPAAATRDLGARELVGPAVVLVALLLVGALLLRAVVAASPGRLAAHDWRGWATTGE